jgi:hypothetical protein
MRRERNPPHGVDASDTDLYPMPEGVQPELKPL